MKVKEIIVEIERFAPLSIQESWDNSGLIIGSPEDEVHGVLVGFDCTPELVDEAVSIGADLILTHHPLIFKGLRKISPDDVVGLSIIKAVRSGVAIYAAHTTADKVVDGVSGAMARRLDLQDVEVLEPDGEGTGLGLIGHLPHPLHAMEAIGLVKKCFNLKVLRTSCPIEGLISKVAVCGGSGSDYINLSHEKGAQLYITGDITYHRFFVPKDYMLMDIGHFESEIDIADIFFTLLRKKFPNFAIHMSGNLKISNPIYYF